jgi:uncharacterized membrane-anchored protein
MKKFIQAIKTYIGTNKEKVYGIIRHVLTTVGGLVIAKGFISESIVQEVIGFVLTILGIVWSINNKNY